MISGDKQLVIVKARPADIDGIKKIADAHRKELGFVRRPSLLEAIDRDEVFVAKQNDEVVGFVEYRHRRDEQTTLYNIALISEFKGSGIGRGLVQSLIDEAKAKGKSHILLKCPEDIPANDFYESMGFQLNRVEPGKKRKLRIWQKSLV